MSLLTKFQQKLLNKINHVNKQNKLAKNQQKRLLNKFNHANKQNKLSKNQQRLLTRMFHFYEQNIDSQDYLNDILSNRGFIEPSMLSLHMASIAFNFNIISGKTTNLISQTIILGDQCPPTYCYGLTGRPWEFIVHSTVYNIPMALIDTRSWRLYPRDIIRGFTIELPTIALQLKLHVLNSNPRRKETLFKKIAITYLKLNILFWRLFYLIVYVPLILFRMRQRGAVAHILKILANAKPLLSLNHDIRSEENPAPVQNSFRIGLISKDFPNFGHYIWNDALGIVTTIHYAPLLQTHFLIEGPWDFGKGNQLPNTALSTFKLSEENLFNGFWCSYPVLALRSLPVLPSAASQLARHLANPKSLSNNVKHTSIMSQLIQSDHPSIIQSRLYVVFTVRLGSRPWLNSLEAITRIASFLTSLNPYITFIIDGMTSSFNMISKDIETMRSEISLGLEIQRSLQENGCDCHVITGLELSSKMSYYSLANLFIQTIGSADIIPHLILRKPIISFGTSFIKIIQEEMFKLANGNKSPCLFLEFFDPDGKGYTVNPEQVIDSILGNKEFLDIFAD